MAVPDPTPSKKKQIIRLLTTLGLSVVLAITLVGGLLYHKETRGTYLASQVLIDPELISHFELPSLSSQVKEPFYFESILFKERQKASGSDFKSLKISEYSKLYALLKSQRSINLSVEEKERLQRHSIDEVSLLFTFVKKAPELKKQYLQVDFLTQEGLFRVELYQAPGAERFAYFALPEPHKKVMQLLYAS